MTTLRANQRVLLTKSNRAHRELGRTVHAVHEKGGDSGLLIVAPEVQAALMRVEEVAENLNANGTKIAELGRTGDRGDSTSS